MSSAISPFDVERVRERSSLALSSYIQEQIPKLSDISDELGPLSEILASFVVGGKRLRPTLAWWGWRGAGGEDVPAMITAATSLELLQACALVHDDVMDGSDTRRGAPSVHRRLEAKHRSNAWSGSASEFGVAGAILIGDLYLSWADQMLFESGLPPEALLRAKPIFDLTRTELMAGQYLDVVEQARAHITPERALRVARFKSAKYTVERPLHLGVALADGSPTVMTTMSEYGLPLGEAFQLRDDVLGVFGDPEITGKPAGDDLREGKQTYLIACGVESSSPSQRAVLDTALGNPELGTSDIEKLQQIIVETGALARTEERIAESTDAALSALDRCPLANNAGEVLRELAFAATKRSH